MQDNQIYKTWRQEDPRYNEKDAWPKELFPKADFHRFKQTGCLVTSLAIMLRKFGIEKEEREEKFNPWVLNQKLIECGAFDEYADLEIEDIKKIYPLEYKGEAPFSKELLIQACHSGQPFLISVPGFRSPHHFIVPDQLEDDDLSIIDCAWGKEHLSEFDTVCEIRLFQTLQSE